MYTKEPKTIVTRYQLNIFPTKSSQQSRILRVALLADLHDRDNLRILGILKKEKPDLIFVAGDLMERHEIGAIQADGTVSPWTMEKMEAWMETPANKMNLIRLIKRLDGSAAEMKENSPLLRKIPVLRLWMKPKWDRKNGYRFIRQASKIAPIYYSIGNHEWYHTQGDAQLLKECGVTVLDNRDTVIDLSLLMKKRHIKSASEECAETNSQFPPGADSKLRIGGLSTRFDREWLEEYSKKDGVKILLMHHPDYYNRMVKETDQFDLILSGHVHGGQWRFFGHGIFAPGQGFLPKLHHGYYPTIHSQKTGKGGMIVSSGCANTTWIPRFGNPCEVVMLELT